MTDELAVKGPYYIDAETSVKCPIGTNKANPMWPPNKVVLFGQKAPEGDYYVQRGAAGIPPSSAYFVVGHNIKFDLLYVYRAHVGTPLPYIWCTQLAEYILTAQQSKYATLDSLIEKYINPTSKKDTFLKEWWDAGKETEDIPLSILEPYLKNDVEVLEPIFLAQWKEATERGCLPLMLAQMDALRATTCMNLVGMKVDKKWAETQQQLYQDSIKIVEALLPEELQDGEWESPKAVSQYFFGGEVEIRGKVAAGKFKNGNVKYKTVINKVYENGLYSKPEMYSRRGANGLWSVDDSVLKELEKKGDAPAGRIQALRKYRKYASTYYQNLLNLVFPSGFIYPQLNHVSTGTGRLSCTQPNLQNQTEDGGVKATFVSRWGEDGVLLEVDYSQLEIVWLAYLSGDKQLIKDINTGTDIHTALFQDMYVRAPTKEERKAFKPRSFQLIYGAGPKAIAEQAGIDISEAKTFIRVFYTRYPQVKEWHEKLLTKAKAEGEVFYKEGVSGPFHFYLNIMPWGRRYAHTSYDNEWSKDRTFSPTELKNYPVQGSATGDMVPTMLGILQRRLEEALYWKNQTALLINTVHDSVLLDVRKKEVYNVAKLVKEVLESAPQEMKRLFNIDFPCKLSVGLSVGKDWASMEEYTV